MIHKKSTRVRFAPSPTGHLHIGGLRGALFNWLFAKKNNGSFIIRIEDTDLVRSKDEYTKAIIDSFEWCNIKSDEPIEFQSQRGNLYKMYLEKLVESGYGYWAEEPDTTGIVSRVLKCRVPKGAPLHFNDLIRGDIQFLPEDIEDFVVARSDGSPLYNFVVVVDDIEMKISHVIRGEEHISNTARQLLLYHAFGVQPPLFAHLPLILGSDGKKLSKRDAATAVIDYKQMGFLPEALCNYLVRLGWSHGDQELFTIEEMIAYFDLKQVHSAGAMFDITKLRWVNGCFIKKASTDHLYNTMHSLQKDQFFVENKNQIVECIELYKDRSETLIELLSSCELIIKGPEQYIVSDEYEKEISPYHIHAHGILELLENQTEKFNKEYCKKISIDISKKYSLPMPNLLKMIRFSVLGQLSSPSIYSIMEILQKETIILRFKNYLEQVVHNDTKNR